MDDQRSNRESIQRVNVATAGSPKYWPFVIATVPWGFAIFEIFQFRALVERNRILFETTGEHLPPTLVGSPLALSFVSVMIGCIILAVAYGKN